MVRRIRPARLLLAAIVGVLIAGCGAGARDTGAGSSLAAPAGTTGAAACLRPGSTTFLTSDGGRFLCGSRPVLLSGFTMYPSMDGGSRAWHRSDFRTYIDRMLDLGAAAGLNLVRPTDQWDRRTTGQTWTDLAVWENLDYLVAGARRRGMFVVLDLSALRWLLVSQGRDPFDPNSWRDFVAFATARYRSEPAVALYSIVGEPAPPATRTELDRLAAFYGTVLDMVHAGDPRHLVTIGALNHMEDGSAATPWWKVLYALPGNDVVAFKTYSRDDLDLLPAISGYARAIRKPLFDGEFGMPQSAGDEVGTLGETFNGLADGRAAFFDRVYATGAADGVAGFVFWNLGCQIAPTSFEVNPGTPAVWRVILDHAPSPPSRPSPEASPGCG